MTSLRRSACRGPLVHGEDCIASPFSGWTVRPYLLIRLGKTSRMDAGVVFGPPRSQSRPRNGTRRLRLSVELVCPEVMVTGRGRSRRGRRNVRSDIRLAAAQSHRFFLDTGIRRVSNACSGEPGDVPDDQVIAHLGNPGCDHWRRFPTSKTVRGMTHGPNKIDI